MKKVIYGILILIGGISIASNFMVDTSKLDHKKVSASGTACKWISDTGYGTGPVYYDATASSSLVFGTDYYNVSTKFKKSIKMFNCTTDIQGTELESGVIYTSSKVAYTGNIVVSKKIGTKTYNMKMEFEDGKLVSLIDYAGWVTTDRGILESYYNGYSLENMSYYMEPTYNLVPIGNSGRDYDHVLDYSLYDITTISNTKYTCVCAEY